MLRPERDRLSGVVEVDEAYVGGLEEGRRGGRRRDSGKSIVVGAVEVRGRGSGRVRLAVVGAPAAAWLVPFVGASVDPRGNARDQPAISVAMKASSQPAYLRLPFRLAFSVVSARARLSAILRSSARFLAAFRSRTRLVVSRKVTSRTQCRPFSPRQWFRIAAASASGGSLALER